MAASDAVPDPDGLQQGEESVPLSRGSDPLRFDILTTFPELFALESPGFLGVSIPARAREAGLVEWHATDIRSYTQDKHSKTDHRPFGGGPGMVMTCQPVYDAVRAVEAMDERESVRLLLSPQGVPLTQSRVESLATSGRIMLLAGHYEGIDERVIEKVGFEEVSLGDYVLSAGELAALVVMDAVIRLLPGALGHADAAAEDSFSEAGPDRRRLLDCPHYTRPRVWEGMEVPDVLLSGDHGAVERWRLEQRMKRTRERRPDLLGE